MALRWGSGVPQCNIVTRMPLAWLCNKPSITSEPVRHPNYLLRHLSGNRLLFVLHCISIFEYQVRTLCIYQRKKQWCSNFVKICIALPRFVASPAGTHFWHSHSGGQRTDGLMGPLIVHPSQSRDPHRDLYDLDLPEHVIMMHDWLVEVVTNRFTSHHHQGGDNKPRNILINGKYELLTYCNIFNIVLNP